MTGDDGLEAVIVAAYPRLLGYARLLTGDQVRAEDVVHEALVRCLRRRRRGAIREFVPYARRAILNEVIRTAERRRKRPEPELLPPAHPQDAVIDHEVLRGWLARLPPRQRAAVVNRFYLDLSEQDTAEMLGCSVSAVKALCQRGLAVLRRESSGNPETAVLETSTRRSAGVRER